MNVGQSATEENVLIGFPGTLPAVRYFFLIFFHVAQLLDIWHTQGSVAQNSTVERKPEE